MNKRQNLREIICQESFKRQIVTLSSGKNSEYYIDGKMTTTHPQGIYLTAQLMLDLAYQLQIDSIGGPMVGADPMVGAIVALSQQFSRPLRGFMVRKETKQHGLSKQLEGQFQAGDRVLVVEDVITTGASVFKAIQAIEAAQGKVMGVTCLVDRLEGSHMHLARYPIFPLFTIHDLIENGLSNP